MALSLKQTGASALLPDHDSWEQTLQQQSIRDWLTQLQIDVALLDGTFGVLTNFNIATSMKSLIRPLRVIT